MEIIREENILSKLDHPYIVKYHESFLHNQTLCIVTEYCSVSSQFYFPESSIFLTSYVFLQGGDLAQKIRRHKKNGEKFSEDRIVYWFAQLLSACYYLHTNTPTILHRNIKPAWVFSVHLVVQAFNSNQMSYF